MTENATANEALMSILSKWANEGMANAAKGISVMLNRPVSLLTPTIVEVPLNEVTQRVGDPETEMVGIYLLTEGDFPGQTILLIDLKDALHLAELLLDQPEGSITELGEIERSALAEMGNVTASFFLNTIADEESNSCRPSPPAVIVDMLGAIVGILSLSMDPDLNSLMVMETVFMESSRAINAHFWVMPDSEFRVKPDEHHSGA
jgi:chemotaxis protein CheC